MNNRIKKIRLDLNLSQQEFGDKLGITRAAISNIEKGDRNPSEQTLKSICREFNVDYFWLTEGIGEMFTALPETIFDEVAEEYDLDEIDRLLVMRYMQLSPEKRKVIKEYLISVFIKKDE